MRKTGIRKLRYKFRGMCCDRKLLEVTNREASGIVEDVTGSEILFAELISKKGGDGGEEECKMRARIESDGREEALEAVEKKIREAASVRAAKPIFSKSTENVFAETKTMVWWACREDKATDF